MACQLNRISSPPAMSIAPLSGTPRAAAGTPLDCAYPVIPLAFVKWCTPAFTKKAAKPMRPTQARMVQRSMAASPLGVGGMIRRVPRPVLLATTLVAACSSGPSAGHQVAVASVAVSPRYVVLRVGHAAQLIEGLLDATV